MRLRQHKSRTVGDRGAAVLRPLCVTVDEAADMLSVGRSKIYQLIADAELDAVKIGKCIRITVASLDLLLRKNSTNNL